MKLRQRIPVSNYIDFSQFPPLKICLGFVLATTLSCSGFAASKEQGMDEMWGSGSASGYQLDPKLEWFVHDKYAMFIHWGLYSSMGGIWKGKTYYGIGEWIMYMASIPVDEYIAHAPNFNPVAFDADAIAKLAKDAGMKMIVITSKHHEGFAMFDSKASDFTITKATPFKCDPMKELADACKRHGIRLGFYYSQFQDWTEPNAGNYKGARPKDYKEGDFDIYFKDKVIPQVTELLTNYGDIALIWFDTPGNMSIDYCKTLVELVQEHQPDCLINSRIGGGYGDYKSLGDMQIPTKRPNVGVWETVDTTNDSWSYAWYDEHWKSPKTIIRNLISVIARGGNYMLNVGPDGKGRIPMAAVRNLEKSGNWISRHAEAIYGASASPFDFSLGWGDCTVKGMNLYLHIFDWPKSGKLWLGGLQNKVQSASFMHNGAHVPFREKNGTIELSIGHDSQPLVTTLKLELDGPPMVTIQAPQMDGQSPTVLLAENSAVSGVEHEEKRWMEKFGEWKHTDNLMGWHTDKDHAEWKVHVLQPGKYTVAVEYFCDNMASGSEWTMHSGDDEISFVTYYSGYSPGKTTELGKGTRLRYMTLELGPLDFKSGIQTVTLNPRSILGDGIGIKRIILNPYL